MRWNSLDSPGSPSTAFVEGAQSADYSDADALEVARIAALHRLDALDRPRRADLNGLVRLAAYVCGAPAAAINLIDSDRQWTAAAYGCEAPAEVSRADSMCAVSMLTSDVSQTSDASADPRWKDNPYVTGARDSIRFYAAAPLMLTSGWTVGTLCAFSNETHQLSRLQVELLRDIADQVVLLLELRDAMSGLARAALRDAQTGLPNRGLFDESLQLALRRLERNQSVAVVVLHLDGIEDIRAGHGADAADELLRAVTERLLSTVRGSDLLARVGEDELAILCETARSPLIDYSALITRLRIAFVTPVRLSNCSLTPSLSIGLAEATGGADDDLLARAEAAMWEDRRKRVGAFN